jgi:hypothetical protein
MTTTKPSAKARAIADKSIDKRPCCEQYHSCLTEAWRIELSIEIQRFADDAYRRGFDSGKEAAASDPVCGVEALEAVRLAINSASPVFVRTNKGHPLPFEACVDHKPDEPIGDDTIEVLSRWGTADEAQAEAEFWTGVNKSRAAIQAHTAALREAGLLREWLQIDSVPKDGRTVLLYYPCLAYPQIGSGFWDCVSGRWWHPKMEDATHWMPLPAAPPYPPDTEGKI